MEDIKQQQLEVLKEASTYCVNVIRVIDTVVPELLGDKKDDTDEYFRMTVDGINTAFEMYNSTKSLLAGEGITIDEASVNECVKSLSAAVQNNEDSAKADALQKIKEFIKVFKEAADKIVSMN